MAKKDNTTPSFYSEEEMIGAVSNSQNSLEDKPVTVLGITFENDAKRREHFREELRKKLPELRSIEGFPIGSDDDIINLSDPPYYTACPNPWLNDFIAQWEEEKKELVKQGKREEEFVVKEPYAYGIVQGKNSAIYNAHSYHTKVPHEVIMRYILHYTQPGDIVLDSFAGTGMTGVAASACGNSKFSRAEIEQDFRENGYEKPAWGTRHAICGDLSPICFHISSNYNSTVNTNTLQKTVDEIIALLKEEFSCFYELPIKIGTNEVLGHVNYFVWSEKVLCKNCNNELNVHDLTFNYNTKEHHSLLLCPNCGVEQKETETEKIYKSVYDKTDDSVRRVKLYEQCLANCSVPSKGRQFVNVSNIEVEKDVNGFLPHIKFPKDASVYRSFEWVKYISDVYADRTKCVLAYLFDLINSKYHLQKKELMFIFTSMLPKLTIMNRYMPQHGSRALVGPLANALYIPPQFVENNPIDQFEYQAKKVIKAFDDTTEGSAVQLCSASESSIKSNSIDYIFTDPPFGENIMYSELNIISESWLKVLTNKKDEAISSKAQKKGFLEYQNIMTECFKEYYRVLKPGKWMTVEFSNTSAAFWNGLQNSIISAGFIISAVTDLNKERGGLFSMITTTSVKQDLAISCYKPNIPSRQNSEVTTTEHLWDFVNNHLSHIAIFVKKDGKSMFIAERDPRIIYDRIVSYYVQNGYSLPMNSQAFQAGLRERYIERDGMFFTATQAAEYDEKKKLAPEFVPMGIIVSDEANGIQWLKNQLRDGAKTYQEIQPEWMQAINGTRKNDIIPELKQLLEENFIEEDGGKWRLPNIQDDKDVNALRTKSLLREFKIYVETAQKPKGKIKAARVEALRTGFKQCYIDKDFQTIVTVGDKIPQNLLTEDEVLLQFYDIAQNKL